jgi:diketogulonate reductase-like aldo/keto reductase
MTSQDSGSESSFRVTSAKEADSLVDGAKLSNGVILPWVGYGTYKLGKQSSRQCTLEALRQGYRCIDTAFIYGGETTETQVGLAIQDAISEGLLSREELVVVTKHWRKYHGYEPTMKCLRLSLKRLQLDSIDLWLMHWPGPAWTTMTRRKDTIAEHGPWHYAAHSKEDIPQLRSETWRAMEDAAKAGKVKAIGVSNFSIAHLERLKKTATIWPPAVNQIECHPLYPQTELLEYCAKEGIVVQGYACLGGQDAGKVFWKKLYKRSGKEAVTKLLNTPPVLGLAEDVNKSSAQVLLRWALEKNVALIPKSSTPERMIENSRIFDFSLKQEQVERLEKELQLALAEAAKTEQEQVKSMGRLCWRSDPLRLLDFD